MNVILINPLHRFGKEVFESQRVVLPVGLLAVATPLDAAGYHVNILDQQVCANWKQLLKAELKKNPVCVGITCMTGPQIHYALEASRIVRQYSTRPVIWGGNHPSLLPKQTLENENIDIVVQGEGEETMLELVQTLANGSALSQIKGIWYKDGQRIRSNPVRPFIDLNDQPPLAYHLLDVEKYVDDDKVLRTFTSRGCPLRCAFCYNRSFNLKRWRALSADKTVERLKRLVETYDVEGFSFHDDNFFVSVTRAWDILETIILEELPVGLWKLDITPQTFLSLDDDFLELLYRSGCVKINIGLETGSERILRLLHKETTVADMHTINKRLKKSGITPKYTFMMGYPTETEAELEQTISLILQLIKDNSEILTSLHIYTPLPGTELFDLAIEHGFKPPKSLEGWIRFNYRTVNLPWLSEDLRRLVKMLHFCTILLDERGFVNPETYVHPVVQLLARVCAPLARWRVKKRFYKFPFEMRLAEITGFYRKQI